MSKKKSNPPEAWDKAGPAGGSLMEGYTWCPECQAAYEGEVCPGCVDLSGAGAQPASAGVAEEVARKSVEAFEAGQTTEAGPTTLAEAAEQASTETTTIVEILPVPLSDAEHKEISKMMAAANQEIVQAEIELKAVKTQYKSRMESAEARRQEYSDIINAGHQQRQVECVLVKDFTANTITLIRQDTYQVVRTRTMTAAEKQRGLDFEGEA